MKGKINDIFESMQGEGIYLGEEQLFVRFFGCNLGCNFCDTKTKDFREYEPQQLMEELRVYQNTYHSVSFTGGEPLLQKDFLKEAMALTKNAGYKNYLETNGILHKELEEVIDLADFIAMDLKLPSSTGQRAFWQEHLAFLRVASRKEVFLKAVVCHSTTGADLRQAIDLIKEINSALILVLQPNSFDDDARLRKKIHTFKEICAKEGIQGCIIPQIHKILDLK
jgi:organic radical activating enzyme